MEKLIAGLNLASQDITFLSGLLLIILTALLFFLVTRDKTDRAVKTTPHDDLENKKTDFADAHSSALEPVKTEAPTLNKISDTNDTFEETEDKRAVSLSSSSPPQQEALDIEGIKEISEPVITKMPEDIPGQPATISEDNQTEESFFSRLRTGLSKTRTGFVAKLDKILKSSEISDEIWDDFEETLVMSDLGIITTMKLREAIEKKSSGNPAEIMNSLKSTILEILKNAQGEVSIPDKKPFVIMVAGVNGVGKTTTIGKLAYKFKEEGKKVMVAAADTFRAAAVEQLEIWSDRVGSEFIKGQMGSDPSAVAFDAVKAAISRKMDVLIIDTAGRLHTRSNLMEELKKLRKILGRELEGAPHETILVLDATTGQNALQQAKMFDEAIELTGIALTKLDGTAKGGVIVSIANELNIPVKYIGIGESLKDLRDFNAEEFVEALFFSDSETIH